MRHQWILLALAASPRHPALADHKCGHQVRFSGIHPIPKTEGGGICYIEGPHVHIYAANKLEYRTHGDDHVFVGDPVAYGYDGPKYAYKGPHPIQSRRSSAAIRTSSTATSKARTTTTSSRPTATTSSWSATRTSTSARRRR